MIRMKDDYEVLLGFEESYGCKQFYTLSTAFFGLSKRQLLESVKDIILSYRKLMSVRITYLEVKNMSGETMSDINEHFKIPLPVYRSEDLRRQLNEIDKPFNTD